MSSAATPGAWSPHAPIREDWLAQDREEVLFAELPIIDAHHHLFGMPGKHYDNADFLHDIKQHNVVATVFMQCKTNYKSDGEPVFRSIGEIEFARQQRIESLERGSKTDICAAIVGHFNLSLGDAVAPVLEAGIVAGGGLLRGVRNIVAWHDGMRISTSSPLHAGRLADANFRRGFGHLSRMGLSFDTWLVHPQIPELCDLAHEYPDTVIVLNHLGGPLRIGPYLGKDDEVFRTWRTNLAELATCPNVYIKLGGFGMPLLGFEFHRQPKPPTSLQIADAIRPYTDACIDLFGAQRCMFESNFPVDKGSFSYTTLWNAFKRLTVGAGQYEIASLFSWTAANVYKLAGVLEPAEK